MADKNIPLRPIPPKHVPPAPWVLPLGDPESCEIKLGEALGTPISRSEQADFMEISKTDSDAATNLLVTIHEQAREAAVGACRGLKITFDNQITDGTLSIIPHAINVATPPPTPSPDNVLSPPQNAPRPTTPLRNMLPPNSRLVPKRGVMKT